MEKSSTIVMNEEKEVQSPIIKQKIKHTDHDIEISYKCDLCEYISNVGKKVGRSGIQTHNPWIDSPRRYRLSYRDSTPS